jgi:hypothetical protein
MTREYAIDNSQYLQDFLNPITIPVTEEIIRNCRLTPHLRSQLTPDAPFTFTLDQAISTSERHMYIYDPGGPTWLINPMKMVHDWVNLLRWEVSTFWKVYRGNRDEIAHTDKVHVHYTHEHPKRSGEVLAEGMALLFLEERMGCPPQCFWFFKGAKARPDFIFNIPFHGIGMMLNGYQFGVEVRCRSSQANLYNADEGDLIKKKQANPQMSNLFGIYFFYGKGIHKKGLAKTRLHLADPHGEGNLMPENERAWVVINHYLGVVSRLGLWDYQEYLLDCLKETLRGRVPETPMEEGPILVSDDPNVPFELGQKWQDFIGAGFNTLIEELREEDLARAKIEANYRILQAQFDSGFFGFHVFKGIRKFVLALIERADWQALEKYRDESTGQHENGIIVTADGVLHQKVPLTDPETSHAKRVINLVKELGYRVKE